MLDTEIELEKIRAVIEHFKNELINITIEIRYSFSKKISEKKKSLLYAKLREMNMNLQAAKEANRILLENPPHLRSVINESIELAKMEEREKRNNYRNRIFYDEFHDKAIDNNIPSGYLSLIYLIVNEIYSIRDAIDPPSGKNFHKELRIMEKEILVDRYAPSIKSYLDKGMNIVEISKKLGLDEEQINYAIDNYKPEKEIVDYSSKKNEDFEERILCSDGNCIGVIGKDGHCKECGKPNSD